MLEITRNIGRISTAWSALTDRSGDYARSHAQFLVASRRNAHRTKTGLSIRNLGNARHESNAGLAALSRAAVIADTNGGKVQAAVTAMHDESTTLARIAGRLADSIALMEDARTRSRMQTKSPRYAALLTQDDRLQIENECAATYSSELERRILRAVLDGDEMPVALRCSDGK